MSASPYREEEREYTDGATPQDIQEVVRNTPRGRGEFQAATSYVSRRSSSAFRDEDDASGNIFDGPGSVVIPSSITGLRSVRTRSFHGSRRNSRAFGSREQLSDGGVSSPSFSRHASSRMAPAEALVDSDEEASLPVRPRRVPSRRSIDDGIEIHFPEDDQTRRTSVFGNIANFFARRDSFSRRSSMSRSRRDSVNYAESPTEEEDNRWGYHSSEEEASEEETTSLRPSIYPESSMGSHSRPPSPTSAFPGLGRDPIFGDTRIDIEEESITGSFPAPSGPPSQQDIQIADEDLRLRLYGFEAVHWRLWIWRIGTTITLGLLGLLGRWFPEFWLYCVARRCPFGASSTNLVVVEVSASF